MSEMIADMLGKTYGHGHAAVQAIQGLSFEIASGEFVAVMGESGAGKSTLLGVLGAMNRPDRGRLTVDGIDVYALDRDRQADFRREFLGFVFQQFHLVPYLTVLENVMLPLTTSPFPRRVRREKAKRMLARVGLEGKGRRMPDEISGGEKERAAIARAVVNDPPIVLADEPTGNLDSRTGRRVMKMLQEINDKGTTIVMVTHSREYAEYAHRLLKISDGRLVH